MCGYDTTPKQLWAFSGGVGDPPGLDARQYWEAVLADGCSGTCFATTNAVDWLCRELGFECWMAGWRLVGNNDGVEVHHATNVVAIDGAELVLETSSSVLEPLVMPAAGCASSDGPRNTTVSCVGGVTLMHTPRAGVDGVKVYRKAAELVTTADLEVYYRDTVRAHPQAQTRLLATRTMPDGTSVSLYEGRLLVRRGLDVLSSRELDSGAVAMVLRCLGWSAAWVERLVGAAAMDFESRRGSSTEPVTGAGELPHTLGGYDTDAGMCALQGDGDRSSPAGAPGAGA